MATPESIVPCEPDRNEPVTIRQRIFARFAHVMERRSRYVMIAGRSRRARAPFGVRPSGTKARITVFQMTFSAATLLDRAGWRRWCRHGDKPAQVRGPPWALGRKKATEGLDLCDLASSPTSPRCAVAVPDLRLCLRLECVVYGLMDPQAVCGAEQEERTC